MSLAFTVAAILFVLIAMGTVVVLPLALSFVGFGGAAEVLMQLCRWPALFLVVTLALASLYRYGPCRARPQWRWVTWGSAFAALLWLTASVLFSWYVANFGSYNATYGSLSAVVGFMIWIWLSTIVVLTGAELNSEMEHQTARDPTAGPRQPTGERGAPMAATLGAPQE